MRINDLDTLMRIRASIWSEAGECPNVILYGVKRNLDKPVLTFTKLSKKYLYDVEGNKYTFAFGDSYGDDPPVSVFTTVGEAWKFFKQKANDRRQNAEDFYIREMKAMNVADRYVADVIKDFPEYFI